MTDVMRTLNRAPNPSRRAVLAAVAFALVLASGLAPLRGPAPVSAGTAENMEAQLLRLINAERTNRGLAPLRLHAALIDLAGDRIAINAQKGVLSHEIAGCLKCQIIDRGIQWFSFGEVLAATSQDWGSAAANSLFQAWKSSPGHWAILMSNTFNYLGIGVAYRSSTGMSYGGIVTTEAVDQTRPWAQNGAKSVKGTTVSWSWTGNDYWLQTHTAGLKNFDIYYRQDSGAWKLYKTTTATTFTLSGRKHGHSYSIQVRSRDYRGLVSNWTPEVRLYVP